MEEVIVEKQANRKGVIMTIAVMTFLLMVAYLAFFSAWWYVRVYGRIGFDSVLFTLTGGLGGVSKTLVRQYLLGGALPEGASLIAGVEDGQISLRREQEAPPLPKEA